MADGSLIEGLFALIDSCYSLLGSALLAWMKRVLDADGSVFALRRKVGPSRPPFLFQFMGET